MANKPNAILIKNECLGQMRIIQDSLNPLFCLSDICKILDIQNSSDVRKSLNNEFGDDGVDLIYPISDELGREQNTIFINESHLYFILMRSDKPKAKPFRQWIIKEVLPSIRKTGSYSAHTKQASKLSHNQRIDQLTQNIKKVDKTIKDINKLKKQLQSKNEILESTLKSIQILNEATEHHILGSSTPKIDSNNESQKSKTPKIFNFAFNAIRGNNG